MLKIKNMKAESENSQKPASTVKRITSLYYLLYYIKHNIKRNLNIWNLCQINISGFKCKLRKD